MKLLLLLWCCFLIGACSCQKDLRDLKMFLPENFEGYGAIIFESRDSCSCKNDVILVQVDSLGIGYASNGDCFPNNNMLDHHFYYLQKGDQYQRLFTIANGNCDYADRLNGRDGLYHIGGELTNCGEYRVLIFFIGMCDQGPLIAYAPAEKKLRERIQHKVNSISVNKSLRPKN